MRGEGEKKKKNEKGKNMKKKKKKSKKEDEEAKTTTTMIESEYNIEQVIKKYCGGRGWVLTKTLTEVADSP